MMIHNLSLYETGLVNRQTPQRPTSRRQVTTMARRPLCEICTGPSCKELHGVEDRESVWKTPGQWPSMAGPAVMILHGLRAGAPVVTDTGCCLSAARRTQA